MSGLRLSWQGLLVLPLLAWAVFTLPIADVPVGFAAPVTDGTITAGVLALLVASLASDALLKGGARIVALLVFVHVAVELLMTAIGGGNGLARSSFFVLIAACWLLAWRSVSLLSAVQTRGRVSGFALRLLIPAIFGAWILIIWEVVTRGAGVPFILLPPPSAIGLRIVNSMPVLWADIQQTIFKAVIIGYALGCGSGFLVAILTDRLPFLRRGLLPIGNLVSALPIIGVAPIMVMWFGFDWHSKAAVVVIMTFFPMLVNTMAGLTASGHMERDLMRTYASGYWQTLFKLRLPAAAPFIFNALKINSTLALIGAIVAEFFGTPVVGMGFRISTEGARMNIDMVWAEIAVAAVCGSVFYGLLALIERAVTFWHPSYR